MIFIWIIVYLIGVVLSYLLLKKDFIEEVYDKDKSKYLIMDRKIILPLALLSWVTAITAICSFACRRILGINGKEKAKW